MARKPKPLSPFRYAMEVVLSAYAMFIGFLATLAAIGQWLGAFMWEELFVGLALFRWLTSGGVELLGIVEAIQEGRWNAVPWVSIGFVVLAVVITVKLLSDVIKRQKAEEDKVDQTVV